MMEFTALFPFGGLGGGVLGFLGARAKIFGVEAQFRILGGIDFDADACSDFEYLTEAPAWCADIEAIEPAELRRRYGDTAPDVVFLSPPCKGASALLSAAKAATAKYQAMNGLALAWLRVMLAAWPEGPRLVLLENVPRLKNRAPAMLREARKLLRGAGYVLSDGYHDCGELGGLAQHRRRYLLVARHAQRCPPLLYQPPTLRVRACGEVLGELPIPASPEADRFGRLHELPKISGLNWLRLSLIPPGGDWRDLPGVLLEDQARREVHKRHEVANWEAPTGVVTGSGSNAVAAVADPRVDWHKGVLGVRGWDESTGAVCGESMPSNGAFAVADPRVRSAYDAGYAVLSWEQAARTIAGTSAVGCGAYAVADPRTGEAKSTKHNLMRVEAWGEPAHTVIGATRPGSGAPSIADPRKPPPFIPVIIARDGTWHRPLTTLELAALQGFPSEVRGRPLELAGRSQSGWRERIGNAVPPPAAQAIATRMLVALGEAELGGWSMSSGAVWVSPEEVL
jgi:site-specific DNA-cytosine methylase